MKTGQQKRPLLRRAALQSLRVGVHLCVLVKEVWKLTGDVRSAAKKGLHRYFDAVVSKQEKMQNDTVRHPQVWVFIK